MIIHGPTQLKYITHYLIHIAGYKNSGSGIDVTTQERLLHPGLVS